MTSEVLVGRAPGRCMEHKGDMLLDVIQIA